MASTAGGRRAGARTPNRSSDSVVLLVGTRKGAFIYRGDTKRREWKPGGPHFLGAIIYQLTLDPRDRRTLLMAARTVMFINYVLRLGLGADEYIPMAAERIRKVL